MCSMALVLNGQVFVTLNPFHDFLKIMFDLKPYPPSQQICICLVHNEYF
jgi:hypothetical protein